MTNSEWLFKTTFSANQLSIYGAVADWCHRFGSKENEQAGNPSAHEENVNQGLMNSVKADEVNSLVSTPRLIGSPGDCSIDMKTIDDMPFSSQLSILCDLVSWRRIQIGDYFITKPSLRDKDGRIDTQCKEDILSRSEKKSKIYCRILREIMIGPVIEIKLDVLLEFTESKLQFLQQEILPRHLGGWYWEGRTDLWIKWQIPVSVTMFSGVLRWKNKQTRKERRILVMS